MERGLKNRLKVFVVLLLIAFIFQLIYVNLMDRDEGLYALFAREMLHGKVPFNDIVDNKPIGLYVLFIPVVLIGGTDFLRFHILLTLMNAVTAFTIYLIAKKLGAEKASVVGALIYLIAIYEPLHIGSMYKSEVFLNLFTVLSFYVLLEGRTMKNALIGGVFTALAILTKQTAILFLPVAVLSIYKNSKNSQLWPSSFLKSGLTFGLGVLATIAVPLLYLQSNGALGNMIYYTLTGLYDPVNLNMFRVNFLGSLMSSVLVALTPIMVSLFLISLTNYRQLLDEKHRLLVAWFCIGCIQALVPPPGTSHVDLILPSLTIMAMLSTNAAKEYVGSIDKKITGRVLKALFCGALLFFFCMAALQYLSEIAWALENETYADSIPSSSELKYALEFLANNTEPGDYIYVAFVEPHIYYFSNREVPVKYPYIGTAWCEGDQEIFKEEILDKLDGKKPQYVVFYDGPFSLKKPCWCDKKGYCPDNRQTFLDYLNEKYTLTGVKQKLKIFVRT
ncbi:MAG: glycosyltransferase family 39 protein [Candidatus Burarchaeum sp.]|nr:glycosyltransferase family 39 protein [Candidatus Burarchaeum sp.]MDO8339895.1 glycosyltransferase family 39 protein [Candidatus Burarchaeum sp.]